jgi:hypothetical protein
LLYEPDLLSQAAFGENLMSERVVSFVQTIFGPVFFSIATLAVDVVSPALAGGACIETLPMPVAEHKPGNVPRTDSICNSCYFTKEVLLWDVRYDRAKGRTCWFLRDAHGRDVTEAHVRSTIAPTPPRTLSSTLASWFDSFNFMRASANAAPESDAAHVSAPDPSRKYQGDAANTKKTDSSIRISQRSDGEARAAKRVSQAPIRQDDKDERALFEEFLRWRERQNMINPLGAPSSMRQ